MSWSYLTIKSEYSHCPTVTRRTSCRESEIQIPRKQVSTAEGSTQPQACVVSLPSEEQRDKVEHCVWGFLAPAVAAARRHS